MKHRSSTEGGSTGGCAATSTSGGGTGGEGGAGWRGRDRPAMAWMPDATATAARLRLAAPEHSGERMGRPGGASDGGKRARVDRASGVVALS